MKRSIGLLAMLTLAACASTPLITAPVSIPARNVAVIGFEKAPPYDDEDEFLDSVIAELQRRGTADFKDERALFRGSNNVLDYLGRTEAAVVLRVSAPDANCWSRDVDEGYGVECIAGVTIYSARSGEIIGHEEASGFGDAAAIRVVDLFAWRTLAASLQPDTQDESKRAAAKERAEEIGKTALNTPQGLSFLLLPAGTFTMGCTAGDDACYSDEKPPHDVTISKPFYLAFTHTTNFQYQKCVDAGACRGTADKTKRLEPVVSVSWDDARDFCAWAGGRLPTEAEWEYAARGGVNGWRFPWGNEAGRDNANFEDAGGRNVEYTSADLEPNPGVAKLFGLTYPFGGTSPVGTFERNGFGLYDMAGNAAQWTADYAGELRVLRGGSWAATGKAGRVSMRYFATPQTRRDTIGFRCARD